VEQPRPCAATVAAGPPVAGEVADGSPDRAGREEASTLRTLGVRTGVRSGVVTDAA
jgi:hypothetical protein